jgi:hypothetical protein
VFTVIARSVSDEAIQEAAARGCPELAEPAIGRAICTTGWPKTTDLRFVLEQTSVLASPDGMMAVVITPWRSNGYHQDGKPFSRPGRAPMVFSKYGGR